MVDTSKFLPDLFNLVEVFFLGGGGSGGGCVFHKDQKLSLYKINICILDCEGFTEYLDCSALQQFQVSDVFLCEEFVIVIWHPVIHLTNHCSNTKENRLCNIWYVCLSIKYTSLHEW